MLKCGIPYQPTAGNTINPAIESAAMTEPLSSADQRGLADYLAWVGREYGSSFNNTRCAKSARQGRAT